ncbi:MAG TPA: hypothetical protein VH855_26375 [Acetobacteraceae bacterium]|jgi:hypothetical protein
MQSVFIRFALIAGLLGALSTPSGHAAVAASGPPGFSLQLETTVSASPDHAFRDFLRIGRWWSPKHTFSGDAALMTLDAKPGGCFCESLPGGGFVRHMDVVFSAPGKTLRLEGGLGPLQGMGASGVMSLTFKPDGPEGKATRLTLTYTVSGFATGKGLGEIAPAVDGVLAEQLSRFKRFAETGETPP